MTPETTRGGPGRTALRVLRLYLLATGTVTTLFLVWMLAPLPLLIDKLLIENDTPVRSSAIVCLGSGSEDGIPSSSGWLRIRTSVALYRDGFAPIVIFSGNSGSSARSEAEIYADGAVWIGLPPQAVRLEKEARNTHEHPIKLLAMDAGNTGSMTSATLLLVTSPYNAWRARRVFEKAGFTRIRVVTSYRDSDSTPRARASGGMGLRAMMRISEALLAAREWAAVVYYKAKGWI